MLDTKSAKKLEKKLEKLLARKAVMQSSRARKGSRAITNEDETEWNQLMHDIAEITATWKS